MHIRAQHVEQGYYDDFDLGPHGVYGNLKLEKPLGRQYCEISKTADTNIRVRQINPSGITISTYNICFKNGQLSHLEITDQWGEVVDRRKYEMVSENSFRLTEYANGVNVFLPCKYAILTYDNELLTEMSFHSISGRLKENDRGYAIVRYKRYDDKVRFAESKETSYFNAENAPVISKQTGYHCVKYEYDESANKIAESYYDIFNKPMMNKNVSSYGSRYKYDQNNNMVQNQYIGANGLIYPNINGIAEVRFEYLNGYTVKVTRYDSSNHIVKSAAQGDGVAIIREDYDNNGNMIRRSTFDESGSPLKDHSGIARVTYVFSPDNMVTSRSNFNESGVPAEDRNKIQSYRYVNDNLGRTIQESYFGQDGMPVKDYSNEVFMKKTKYDADGRDTSESYWKDSLTPMPRWNGVYEKRNHYNEDGQIFQYDYLDNKGLPSKSENGYSECQLFFDENGVMYKRQYSLNNINVNTTGGASFGFSIIRYEHDTLGRVNQILFYGSEHEAINATIDINQQIQTNRIDFIYKGSRIVEQWYYSIGNNEPFLKLDCLKNDYLNTSGINIGHKNAN